MKWNEAAIEYVFRGKSEAEIDNLCQTATILGQQARIAQSNGDHTFDTDIESYDNIAENASDVLEAKKTALQAKGVKMLPSGVRVYPTDYEE